MDIGFTGTQDGMTARQQKSLRIILACLFEPESWFSHGDCIGADEQAHHIAKQIGYKIDIHPPKDPKKRAFCSGEDISHEPKDYLDRNKYIVDGIVDGGVLIATPKTKREELRSGTWSTVRYARRREASIWILNP